MNYREILAELKAPPFARARLKGALAGLTVTVTLGYFDWAVVRRGHGSLLEVEALF